MVRHLKVALTRCGLNRESRAGPRLCGRWPRPWFVLTWRMRRASWAELEAVDGFAGVVAGRRAARHGRWPRPAEQRRDRRGCRGRHVLHHGGDHALAGWSAAAAASVSSSPAKEIRPRSSSFCRRRVRAACALEAIRAPWRRCMPGTAVSVGTRWSSRRKTLARFGHPVSRAFAQDLRRRSRPLRADPGSGAPLLRQQPRLAGGGRQDRPARAVRRAQRHPLARRRLLPRRGLSHAASPRRPKAAWACRWTAEE